MAKRCLLLLCLLGFLLCLLCGCSTSAFADDYLVVQEHREPEPNSAAETDIPEVGTYLTLKAAILDLVLEGADHGVIRLSDFTTDEIEAMSMACWEVKSTTPYGAYAVDHISYDYTEILGYYDMDVYISYRRYQSQIDSLLALSTPSQVRAALRSALRSYNGYIAISVSDSSIDEDFIQNYVETYYYANPMYMLSCPRLELYSYPGTGVKRILEAFVQYPYSPDEMSNRIIVLNQESRELLNGILRTEDATYALDICRTLTDRCSYVPEDTAQHRQDKTKPAYTAYGAILDGQANSEGYAMAYKLLCDIAGIECQVILGRLDGADHAWNIIKLGEDYYHVDPAACALEGYDAAFLRSDEQMWSRYWWDTENIPACNGSLRYWQFVGQPEPGAPETTTPEETPPAEETPQPSPGPGGAAENGEEWA